MDDFAVVMETVLLGMLGARLYAIDSVAMVMRVGNRIEAMGQAVNAAMSETASPPAAEGPMSDPPLPS